MTKIKVGQAFLGWGVGLAVLVGAGVACSGSGDGDAQTMPMTGEELYTTPLTAFGGNTFACATCHALEEPAADGMRRVAHQIGDAAGRSTFKNGQLTSLLDAVNTCLVEWMAMGEPWTEDTPSWSALEEFLTDESTGREGDEISFDIVAPSTDAATFEGGDPVLGGTLFNTSCATCHGTDATGTERAPALVPATINQAGGAPYIARRVRTSGPSTSAVYDGLTDGRMPFWSQDRLSDAELNDLVTFILTNDAAAIDPAASGGTGMRECSSTHDKVGYSAALVARFHNVGGTATIIDDCTVRIDDFTFDGTGINVQVYGGAKATPTGPPLYNFSMSGDIRRTPAYLGETLTVQLPEDRTLDDLDGVSIWCVPVSIDFGSGEFMPAE